MRHASSACWILYGPKSLKWCEARLDSRKMSLSPRFRPKWSLSYWQRRHICYFLWAESVKWGDNSQNWQVAGCAISGWLFRSYLRQLALFCSFVFVTLLLYHQLMRWHEQLAITWRVIFRRSRLQVKWRRFVKGCSRFLVIYRKCLWKWSNVRECLWLDAAFVAISFQNSCWIQPATTMLNSCRLCQIFVYLAYWLQKYDKLK